MGMPSMGIYSYELYTQHGVENIIRVGTAGSFNPNIIIGDIVCGLAASTDSNYQHTYDLPGYYAPCCSYELLQKLQMASAESGISFTAGNIVSCDVFYETIPDWWKRWASMGVMAVEMEAAGLYLTAMAAHKKALALFQISDHIYTGEALSAAERQDGFREMMEVALTAASRVAL
jgi:purine-nucleoside phosphorylase